MTNSDPRGVGYIAGESLEQLKQQWATLVEAEVDVILFDRHFLMLHFDQTPPSPNADETEAMWRYIETMRAGQSISGNTANYESLEDIQADDTIVVTELATLRYASPDSWERLYGCIRKGAHLADLSTGFHSAGEFGSKILWMLNEAYALGVQQAAKLVKEFERASPKQSNSFGGLVAAALKYLDDDASERFELHECSEAPDGWYRTFDPSGWIFFSIVDSKELRIGGTRHIAVNASTLEVRDIGFIGE